MNTSYKKRYTHSLFDTAENIVNNSQTGATIIVPHPCNNKNMFYGGLSKEIENKYPKVKADFNVAGNQSLGKTQFVRALSGPNNQNLIICNMIVLDSTKDGLKIKYLALIKCLSDMQQYISKIKTQDDSNRVQIFSTHRDFPCSKPEFDIIKNIIQDTCLNTTTLFFS